MKLEIRNINKSFTGKQLFNNLNLSFSSGKTTCIIGPSGCGKTTLLNIIAGTQKIDSGEIYPGESRSVAYLFQDSRLLPWLTVMDNVMYLMERSLGKAEKRERALELIDEVNLSGYENSYPDELSGGMSRRAALARALGCPAPFLLMDEPFASLDNELKFQIVELVKNLLFKENRTTICVTHDLNVAEALGDVLISLEKNEEEITFVRDRKGTVDSPFN